MAMYLGFRIRLKDLVWLVPAVTAAAAAILTTYPKLWSYLKLIGL